MKPLKRILTYLTRGRVLLAITLASLITPNVVLSVTDHLPLMAAAVNVVLPLGIYILLMSLSRNIGRSVWLMFPLVFFGAFQMVLLSLYHRSVIAVDMLLNLVTTNVGEASELLGNMAPTLLLVVGMYVPPLVLGAMAWSRGVQLPALRLPHLRQGGMALTVTGLVLLAICISTDTTYSMSNDLYPVNVGYNVGQAFSRVKKTHDYYRTSDAYRFDSRISHEKALPETYVLVIGETSRADHWSLNGYGRLTTPRLQHISCGKLYNYGRAMSESNTTHKSVPLMLSALTPSTFGDSIYYVKSLISAFKEAGYATAFLSAQQRNGSFIDFFGEEADTALFLHDHPELNSEGLHDMALVEALADWLSRTPARKRLVVLHTYGSHFNYHERYADSERRFVPDRYDGASIKEKARLVNAYDNTIRQTDHMLSEVIGLLEATKGISGMVYTSDHGEDLFDDGRKLFLHASPCPSFHQLHVPFLVWVSDGYAKALPANAGALASNESKRVSSNTSFFDTALDLAGITSKRAERSSSLANPGYRCPKPMYINDHNHGVPLSASGFEDIDLALYRQL